MQRFTAHPASAQRLREAELALRSGQARAAERLLLALDDGLPGRAVRDWLLGRARLDQGRATEAIETLTAAVALEPQAVGIRVDLGRALRAAQRPGEARDEVRRVLEREPRHALAWLAYGDVLVDLGQPADARIAFERFHDCDPQRLPIEAATRALVAEDRRDAEERFRQLLRADPAHVPALCGLAALSLAADVPADAERLLQHARRQTAWLPLLWRGLGPALLALGRLAEAEAAARYLRTIEPESPHSWVAVAAVATRLLRPAEALEAYRRAFELQPGEVRLLTSMGHLQKTLGQRAASEASYRAALALEPAHAEAYWSLADLKNYSFADGEITAMETLLADGRADRSGDAQLHFALGRAHEQRSRFADSFCHYARGNELRRRTSPFDIGVFERRSQRIRRFFDQEFFAARADWGHRSRAPIFIVGLPRSGSTLIEQILASHSEVEGTMELPNVLNYVRDAEDRARSRDAYPESLEADDAPRFEALGRRYLDETAPLRTGRPRFTDKLPNNFSHVGLIHLMLPNAVVIDARRHPLDCCLSNFKQHFAEGQSFSYDLGDLGRYYRAYLALMDHWDAVLPGRVLRVEYERLVHDPEAQIRRLLLHCGLGFEPACLSFHATERAVRTSSAEQVRQPLHASGIGYWRHFDAHLGPLRAALGDALDRFGSLA
ncbi:MAG: sulfotransferase [Proteobacteria bacterium]|nr:sulfotransferase [Pseudomonadota bacterium]